MGESKKDPGVLIRLPPEIRERVAAWSSETGKTIHELLLDAIQRSFLAWPEDSKEKISLQQENELLKKQLAVLNEALRSYYPEEQPTAPVAPRRVSPEDQKKALLDAQKRLEQLRAEKRSRPVQLPTTKSKEVAALREVEGNVRQVATEMLSPRSSMMTQKRTLAQRGRIEGVAYEENEDLAARAPKKESAPKPPHIKESIQKKAQEIAQRQATTRETPTTPQGHGRKKP